LHIENETGNIRIVFSEFEHLLISFMGLQVKKQTFDQTSAF